MDQLSYYPRLAARARELARSGHDAAAVADILNSEGFRPPKRRERFGAEGIRHLLRDLGCVSRREQALRRTRPALGPDQWRLTDLARELGIPRVTLYGWLTQGRVTGHQADDAHHSWIIQADAAEVDRLRALHQQSRGHRPRQAWLDHQRTAIIQNGEGEPRR